MALVLLDRGLRNWESNRSSDLAPSSDETTGMGHPATPSVYDEDKSRCQAWRLQGDPHDPLTDSLRG
jgi:hypothetical protein